LLALEKPWSREVIAIARFGITFIAGGSGFLLTPCYRTVAARGGLGALGLLKELFAAGIRPFELCELLDSSSELSASLACYSSSLS